MLNMNKFFLGFGPDVLVESYAKTVEKMAKMANYPPFNIKKLDDNKYTIELAVAGFAKSQLSIEIEGNKLVVSGISKEPENENGEYLYKGLASRAFKREWVLADSIEVTGSELTNGVLKIWLEALTKASKRIEINE